MKKVFETETFPPLPRKTWFKKDQFDEETLNKRYVEKNRKKTEIQKTRDVFVVLFFFLNKLNNFKHFTDAWSCKLICNNY